MIKRDPILNIPMRNISNFILATVLIIYLVPINIGYAQQINNTFSSLHTVAQRMEFNPAIVPKHKLTIALPAVDLGVNLQLPVSYSDFITGSGTAKKVNISDFANALGDTLEVGVGFQVNAIFVAFKVGSQWNFHLYSGARVDTQIYTSEGVKSLLLEGNPIGSNIVTKVNTVVNSWSEFGLGASYNVNDNWTVGLRLKFNKGIFGGIIQNADATINTTEQSIKASVGLAVVTTDIKDKETADYINNISSTPIGFATDIGLTYKHDENWWLGLGIKNLIGSVNYVKLRKYTISAETATYEYKGALIQNVIDNKEAYVNSSDDPISADDIKKKFEPTEFEVSKLSISLPTSFFLNGEYAFPNDLRAGGMFYYQPFNGNTEIAYGIYGAKDFGRIFNFTLSANYINQSFNNIGMGFSLDLKPVQLYLATDNVFVDMKNLKTLNLRLGINLIFGADKKQLQFKNL